MHINNQHLISEADRLFKESLFRVLNMLESFLLVILLTGAVAFWDARYGLDGFAIKAVVFTSLALGAAVLLCRAWLLLVSVHKIMKHADFMNRVANGASDELR